MSQAPKLSQRAHWAAGQPISRLMQMALARPELISLAAGFVDQQTLPVETTRAAIERVLAQPAEARAALQYGTTLGDARLRELVLERFQRADGNASSNRAISIDQIMLTAGSNQLLHLVADTLLDPGDIVLCATPSYFVFLGTLGNLGAQAVGVATDAEGPIPNAIDEQLKQFEQKGELARVKAIYVTTYFDNPTSITLSLRRREQLVEIARRWSKKSKLYILEDAAYRELRYTGEDLPSLRSFDPQGDTVIVAETFSKSFSPGVRVGWGILPPELVAPMAHQKGNIDFGSPHFSQRVMASVLEMGLLEPHILRLRSGYREKLAAMLAAAKDFLADIPGVSWLEPTGGLYVWLTLPEGMDAGPGGSLFGQALQEGVIYVPGEYCFAPKGEPVANNTIRLSFGVQGPAEIRRGIEALGRAIRHVHQCVDC